VLVQHGGESEIGQGLGVFVQRSDDVRLVCVEVVIVTVHIVGADHGDLAAVPFDEPAPRRHFLSLVGTPRRIGEVGRAVGRNKRQLVLFKERPDSAAGL
jgi:hypothetical protein